MPDPALNPMRRQVLFCRCADASRQSEEQQVLAVEDECVAAEVRRDEATLRRVVDDRFVLNSSNGKTSDEEALIPPV